jgi:hypothetical protein
MPAPATNQIANRTPVKKAKPATLKVSPLKGNFMLVRRQRIQYRQI